MAKYILYKDSNLERPKNKTAAEFAADEYGQEYIYEPKETQYNFYFFSSSADFLSNNYKKLEVLKNYINRYSAYDDLYNFSNFYNVTSSIIAFTSNYLGSGIEKGSVELNIYVSGTLLDRATDSKENGILSSSLNGKIGVILYKEGFILLNNNSQLTTSTTSFNGTIDNPRWTNIFANDLNSDGIRAELLYSAVNTVPTNTIFVTADKFILNHSNNITYIQSGSYTTPITSNVYFKENKDLKIKNVVKSPFISGSAPFEKETYITKIGLYDKDKNLIGYATLANPVRKTENREFIFKLKLDI